VVARHSFAFVVCGSLVGLVAGVGRGEPGCGGAESPSSGPNAPCTRTKDCGGDLVCAEGVCTELDAGVALPDGGRDAPPSGDAADGPG
jgi:hypothetical protein